MGLSDFNAIQGDSGVPMIYHNGQDSILVGSLVGESCFFSFPSENRYGITSSSNTINICSNSEFIELNKGGRFNHFNAWENIKDEINGLNID